MPSANDSTPPAFTFIRLASICWSPAVFTIGLNTTVPLVALEDSVNGAIAAKSALMQLIVVPDPGVKHPEKFVIADHTISNMHEVLTLFKSLIQ